jgi:molybdate-binding protein
MGVWDEGEGRVRVEPLEEMAALERTVLLAGCTPALSLWARAAERWHPGLRVHWTFANSQEALRRLARGEVHAAGLHLWDAEREEFNAPFVREALGGQPALLVNLGVWEEGLVTWPGNPERIRGAEDLNRLGRGLVNREEGSGARLLLDQALAEAGMEGRWVKGYLRILRGHLEVAREVARRGADVGVTTSAVAASFGLGFVPLRAVRYDLALRRGSLEEEPVRQLLASLDHRWMRSQLQVLVGYDTSRTGEVVAEIGG